MRMRELEQRTGVGRETIRFYIREGLLPEPARASRNSASYSDEHVTSLRAIKRLQEERFLPLAVIRTLLADDNAACWLEPQAFPGLDTLLRTRLDNNVPRIPTSTVMAQTGCTAEQLAGNVALGLVEVDADGTMTGRDASVLRVLHELEMTGFTEARGFTPAAIRIYLDFVEWLTTSEMRLFFDHVAGRVDESEATDMAERGIASINELLGLLRTKALLAKLAARRTSANDNG